MLGNVKQWVEDYFAPYPDRTVTDPVVPGPSEDLSFRRVVRGTSSGTNSPEYQRVSARGSIGAYSHEITVGISRQNGSFCRE
jgi:formylglycine-generating enzyme required for sulfatase activity